MIEASVDDLRQAVEGLHTCRASLREVKAVKEEFQGQTVWEGIVHVFDIEDCPTAKACFAWSSPIEGTERRKFYAVLQVSPINTPNDAVRASIVRDARQ
jgi:hypothetical protein